MVASIYYNNGYQIAAIILSKVESETEAIPDPTKFINLVVSDANL